MKRFRSDMALHPVRIGSGREVHAGAETGSVKKGRVEYKSYRSLCGSGDSTLAHSFRTASVRLATGCTLADVSCQKCLATMQGRVEEVSHEPV